MTSFATQERTAAPPARPHAGRVPAAPVPGVAPPQRQLGNRAFRQAGGPRIQRCACGGTCPHCKAKEEAAVQTKLTVGPPGDAYEREADAVAERVARMPEPGAGVAGKGAASGIQRLAGAGSAGGTTDLSLPMGGARPLSPQTRAFMEPRFGADFSGVRVHAGHQAEAAASRLNARAFTHGRDVWLGRGESEGDRRLMAHELTHVVQQAGGGGTVQRYTHEDCADPDLRAHIWPADAIARGMTEKAIRVLGTVPLNAAVTPLLTRYFMTATPDLPTLLKVYGAAKAAFDADGYQYECEEECDPGEIGYVYGVWSDVHMCMPKVRSLANNTCIARTIVHEFTHYYGGTDDNAYCKSGCAYSSCPASLSASDAEDNADSYACFAYELYPMAV